MGRLGDEVLGGLEGGSLRELGAEGLGQTLGCGGGRGRDGGC